MSSPTSAVPGLLTLGQVAHRLCVAKHQAKYAIDEYGIQPLMRVGIIRVWGEDSLPQIKSALDCIAANRGTRDG